MGFDPTTLPRDPEGAVLPPAAVARLLAASRDTIVAELRGLGDELASWPPGEGEWSAKECVGHLIEADRRGFLGRIRRILAEDGVAEVGWDQVEVAAGRRDRDRPLDDVLAEFTTLRDEGIALVETLAEADLDRYAVHAVVGRVTVRDLLQEWVFHDRNHVRQLLLSAQARVWPVMGATRRFTRDDG
jgi:uncharacterized damage-inducible protein DinB